MGNASCPPGEIQAMIHEADVDGDGTISFTEFVILISGGVLIPDIILWLFYDIIL